VTAAGFSCARRSEYGGALPDGTDVLVGDTMGELHRLYAAADVAFVGGSLVRHGGQNLLEAFSVGVPVVFGPHMFHFEEISAMALDRGAAFQVRDASELVDAVALLFDQPGLRQAAAQAAQTMLDDNRGALDRTVNLMTEHSFERLRAGAGDARSALGHAPAG
jgi:3-deoxy-D-manno-octulosonic-acid transferase